MHPPEWDGRPRRGMSSNPPGTATFGCCPHITVNSVDGIKEGIGTEPGARESALAIASAFLVMTPHLPLGMARKFPSQLRQAATGAGQQTTKGGRCSDQRTNTWLLGQERARRGYGRQGHDAYGANLSGPTKFAGQVLGQFGEIRAHSVERAGQNLP